MFEQIQVGNVSDTIGRNGQVISPSHMNDERNYPITEGRALQVWTILMDASPDAADVYNINILGETVSLTVAAETQAQAVDDLVAKVNANPIMRGVFTASNTGPDTTITLTANNFGTDVAVTIDGTGAADLTLSEDTEPADATQIGIGVAMYYDGSGSVTVTNPNSGDLDEFAGFTRLLLEEEQTGVAQAAATSDLYEDREDVCVFKRGEMIVDTGDAGVENGFIWIEQAAGATLGKAYAASSSTGHTLVVTPTAVNDFEYTILLNIDGEIVYAEYLADGTATAQEIVEGLQLDLANKTETTLLTATEDNVDLTITLADSDATLIYSLSDNLAGVQDDGTTRLKLPKSKGVWGDPNKIQLKGGF